MQRPPGRVLIRQNGQTGDRPVLLVKDAVVVDVHPQGKVPVFIALDLDMDHDMKWFILQRPHPDQLIRMSPAYLSIPHHLLQLFVKELIPFVPGDPCSDIREKELHQFLEIQFHALFPGAVIVVHMVVRCVHVDILYHNTGIMQDSKKRISTYKLTRHVFAFEERRPVKMNAGPGKNG